MTAEEWEHKLAKKDDPHVMGSVRGPTGPFGYYHRERSCDWNLASQDRTGLMAAAKKHRALVAFYRWMAKKEVTK